MVEDHIREIEARVKGSGTLPDGAKAELLALLNEVRAELEGVRQEQLATVKASPDPLGGLTEAVTGLEATHPRLAELVNRLAIALGNMGI